MRFMFFLAARMCSSLLFHAAGLDTIDCLSSETYTLVFDGAALMIGLVGRTDEKRFS